MPSNVYTREQADQLVNIRGLNEHEQREVALFLVSEGTCLLHALWLRGFHRECACAPCTRAARDGQALSLELPAIYAEAMVTGDYARAGRVEVHLLAVIEHWDNMAERSERIRRSALRARVTNPCREALGLETIDPVAIAQAELAEAS